MTGEMSVSISAGLIAVGLPTSFQTAGDDVVGLDTFNGEVHLFARSVANANPWSPVRIILSPTAADPQFFGRAIGLDSGSLVVGSNYGFAPGDSGSAYLIEVTGCGLGSNEPPTVSCPNPVTVESGAHSESSLTLTASVQDRDGDAITVVWSVDGNPVQTDSVPTGSPTTSATVSLTRTFALGTHTVTVTVSDGTAPTVSCSTTVAVQDTTPPLLTCPANIVLSCSASLLVPATFAATASDAADPAPVITYSHPSGSGFPVGVTTVQVTARDASGNESTCAFTVTRAALGFTGFHSPIGGADAAGGSFASPLRTFKLKSTIPVKFTATCEGSPVLTGVHTLQAIKWTDETTSATPIDATPTDAATTGNQFRLTGSDWHFNLDTLATGMSAGKWQLIATLADGSQHTAWIQIK